MRRLYEADALAFQVTVAAELQHAGYPQVMMAAKRPKFIQAATAFEDAMKKDPESLFNGVATQAAFNAFYDINNRVNMYDIKSIREFEPVQEDMNSYNPEDILRGAMEILSFIPYEQEDGTISNKRRKGYMTESVRNTVLNDPHFTNIRDARIYNVTLPWARLYGEELNPPAP